MSEPNQSAASPLLKPLTFEEWLERINADTADTNIVYEHELREWFRDGVSPEEATTMLKQRESWES